MLSEQQDRLRRINRWLPAVVLGLVIGIISAFSMGSLFILFLVLLTGLFLYGITHREERKFVLVLFLIGFLVRSMVSVGLDLGSWIVEGQGPSKYAEVHGWNLGIVDRTREYIKIGDSDYYSQRGYAIAQYAKEVREPVVLFRVQQYGWNGYVYVIGLFYYLFGYSPVSVKLINCLLGALLGPILFFLAKSCFNASIGRWSSIAVAFFPSLILWSATNLKESSFIGMTLLLLLLFSRIRESPDVRSRLFYGCLFLFALLVHMTLRSAFFSFLLVGAVLISQGIIFLKRKSWFLVLTLGVVAGFTCMRWVDIRSGLMMPLFYRHLGYVGTAGVSYEYLPEEFYTHSKSYRNEPLEDLSSEIKPAVLVLAVAKSVFHYLVEPLPWKMDNLFLLFISPQMLFWYLILLLAFLGIGWSLRWNLDRSLFLCVTLFSWIVLMAPASGNVGTLFRIRDTVTPFFLIFASVGIRILLHSAREENPG